MINLSKEELIKLKPLNISKYILNTEAAMFTYDFKSGLASEQLVIKRLYNEPKSIYDNKIKTITSLIDNYDVIGMPELVLPTSLVECETKVVGFAMPYIPNINLQEILNSREYLAKEKIAYLKEIGGILEKLKQVRKNTPVKNLYLNDIHEANFILNSKTGKINCVDMDSVKIGDNVAMPSKYLCSSMKLYKVEKYIHNYNQLGSGFEIDENTDIYCYIIMILNFIFGSSISWLSIEEFYDYMEYLKKIGISQELIDKFVKIYSNGANENPYEYLDELAYFYGRTHINTYEAVKRKTLQK